MKTSDNELTNENPIFVGQNVKTAGYIYVTIENLGKIVSLVLVE